MNRLETVSFVARLAFLYTGWGWGSLFTTLYGGGVPWPDFKGDVAWGFGLLWLVKFWVWPNLINHR